MKNYLVLLLLILPSLAFSQIDFAKQVKKKDVKNVKFYATTDGEGNNAYGFKIDGKLVGPNMVISNRGEIVTYSNYNKNNDMDGTTIVMNNTSGEIDLYTYRKNEKDGPAFQIASGKVGWIKMFEKGQPSNKEYKVNHAFDYYTPSKSTSFDGFTMEKYKSSYALGYFAYGRASYPIIFVYNEGDSYYGQCIQGQRKEFGVYIYKDKSKYVGAWHQGYKEGLGFKVDAKGEIVEKGFYKGGKLVTSI